MNENRMARLAIAAAVLLVVLGITAAMVVRPAQASEIEPEWTWKVAPSDITNSKALREMRLEKLKAKIDAAIEER